MRAVLTVELALALSACLAFIGLHAGGPWRRSPAGRQLMAMAAVAGAELAVLLLVLSRVHLPWWVLVSVYGAVDVVMLRWLLLKWRARREERTRR